MTPTYNSEMVPIPGLPHVSAQDCLSRLQTLSRKAHQLPFHQMSTKLYAITSVTLRNERVDVVMMGGITFNSLMWTPTLVRSVISVAMETVKTIYKKMRASDLKEEKFDPDAMELETRRVMFFIETLHQKYELRSSFHHDLMVDYPDPSKALGFVPESQRILRILERKIRFQKSPSLTEPTSTLWSKINRARSLSSLLGGNSEAACPACWTEEWKDDGNVAIVDCCNHSVCVKCAKNLFDVHRFKKSLCPACNRPVQAWTDSEHFHQFKTTQDPKSVLWRFMQRKRTTRRTRNLPWNDGGDATATPYTALL